MGANRHLPPVVWRIQFPNAIQEQLVSSTNPAGKITNSDLEMAGLLMHWLVLESIADLQHTHIATGCDNTPTVAWTTRLLATKAPTAAHLIRVLALCMLACQASPLTAFHLPGETNRMADIASRSLKTFPNDKTFLTHFALTFPLPQGIFWNLFLPSSNTAGKLFSTLQTTTSPMAWWLQTTNKGSVIGATGSSFSRQILTTTFKAHIANKKFPSYKLSLSGSGKEISAEAIKSRQEQSKTPSGPSARPSNWMATKIHSTNQEPRTTTSGSAAKSKHSNEMTPHCNRN